MGATAFSKPLPAELINYYVPLPFEQIKSMADPYQKQSDALGQASKAMRYVYADSPYLDEHKDLWEAKNKEAYDNFEKYYGDNNLDFNQAQGEFYDMATKAKHDPVIKQLATDYGIIASGQEALKKAKLDKNLNPQSHNIRQQKVASYEIGQDGKLVKTSDYDTTPVSFDRYVDNKEINERISSSLDGIKKGMGWVGNLTFNRMVGDKAVYTDSKGKEVTEKEVKKALDAMPVDAEILREMTQRAEGLYGGKVTGTQLYDSAKKAIALGNVWREVDKNYHFVDTGEGGPNGGGLRTTPAYDFSVAPTTAENTTVQPFDLKKLIADRSALLTEKATLEKNSNPAHMNEVGTIVYSEEQKRLNFVKNMLDRYNKDIVTIERASGLDFGKQYDDQLQDALSQIDEKISEHKRRIGNTTGDNLYAKQIAELTARKNYLKSPEAKKLYREEALGISTRFSDNLPGGFVNDLLLSKTPSIENEAFEETAKNYNTKKQQYDIVLGEKTVAKQYLDAVKDQVLNNLNLEIENEEGEVTTIGDKDIAPDWNDATEKKLSLSFSRRDALGNPKVKIEYGPKEARKISYAAIKGLNSSHFKEIANDFYRIAEAQKDPDTKARQLATADTYYGSIGMDPNTSSTYDQVTGNYNIIRGLKKGESTKIYIPNHTVTLKNVSVNPGESIEMYIDGKQVTGGSDVYKYKNISTADGVNGQDKIFEIIGAFKRINDLIQQQ